MLGILKYKAKERYSELRAELGAGTEKGKRELKKLFSEQWREFLKHGLCAQFVLMFERYS